MELWDVYDGDRNKTGKTVVRGEGLKEGEYHLVVHVWIRNSKGQCLISKRTPNKTFPLMWECTGGSALVGDDSLTAALREVKEEIGIDLSPDKGTCIATNRMSDFFRDVWLFEDEIGIESVVFQQEEVCDAKWATEDEIKRMIEDGTFIDHFTYLDKVFSNYNDLTFSLPVLIGEKVILEPLDIDKHKEGYFKVSLDEKMHEWTGNVIPKNVEEIAELLKVYENLLHNWIIIDKTTSNVIGIMRITNPTIHDGKLVSGDSQRLHSDYWRKGYMKDARRLVYDYAFDQLNVEELHADVWDGNVNSAKSLESVGYVLYDQKEECFEKYGRSNIKRYYRLKMEDWMAVKENY